jgi:hypothetical protein
MAEPALNTLAASANKATGAVIRLDLKGTVPSQ